MQALYFNYIVAIKWYLLCMWLLLYYTINTGVNITSVAIIVTAGGNIISVAISATARWQYHFCSYYCHRRWQYHFCGFLLTPVFRWQYHRPIYKPREFL